MPWPDVNDAGAVSMLQTLRTAAGVRSVPQPSLSLVLPIPGDVRGLLRGPPSSVMRWRQVKP